MRWPMTSLDNGVNHYISLMACVGTVAIMLPKLPDQNFMSQKDSSFAARRDVAIAWDAAGLRRTAAAWIETYHLS